MVKTFLNEGTRNKLDYACTKSRNLIDDFYYYGKTNERLTPNIEAVCRLENEMDTLENIISTGYVNESNWKLVSNELQSVNKIKMPC